MESQKFSLLIGLFKCFVNVFELLFGNNINGIRLHVTIFEPFLDIYAYVSDYGSTIRNNMDQLTVLNAFPKIRLIGSLENLFIIDIVVNCCFKVWDVVVD